MSDVIQLICKAPSGSRPYFYLGTCKRGYIMMPEHAEHWNMHLPERMDNDYMRFDESTPISHILNVVSFRRMIPYVSRLPYDTVFICGSYEEAVRSFECMVEAGIARADDHSLTNNGVTGFAEYCHYMYNNGMTEELHDEIDKEINNDSLLSYIFSRRYF